MSGDPNRPPNAGQAGHLAQIAFDAMNALRTENGKLRVENVRLRHLLKAGENGQAAYLLRRALGALRGIAANNPAAELAAIEAALDGGPLPVGLSSGEGFPPDFKTAAETAFPAGSWPASTKPGFSQVDIQAVYVTSAKVPHWPTSLWRCSPLPVGLSSGEGFPPDFKTAAETAFPAGSWPASTKPGFSQVDIQTVYVTSAKVPHWPTSLWRCSLGEPHTPGSPELGWKHCAGVHSYVDPDEEKRNADPPKPKKWWCSLGKEHTAADAGNCEGTHSWA